MMKNFVVVLFCCGVVESLHAQAPSAADNLAAGVSQVKAGDFFRAVLTLNEAVAQLAAQPGAVTTLARVHAYRAAAYVGLDQPERARAAVLLALGADPNVAVGASEFSPAVVALFSDARRPPGSDSEAAGRDAEQGGRLQQAFLSYLTAYHALPDPPPAADDRRLREKIIKVVAQLGTAPIVPPDARARVAKADQLLGAEAILGSSAGSSSQAAAAELRRAVRAAPWWAEATLKLATVLQRLQQPEEALLNLNLYRLADPDGYGAMVARTTAKVAPEPVARATVPKPIGPAVIYIYWPEQQRGGGKQKVQCNGTRIADLQNNRFVALKAAAGTHSLTFRDKQVTVVVEAGGEYYYRASIEGQWRFAMGPELRFVEADLARDEMREQAMSANDVKHTASTQCVAAPGRNRKRD